MTILKAFSLWTIFVLSSFAGSNIESHPLIMKSEIQGGNTLLQVESALMIEDEQRVSDYYQKQILQFKKDYPNGEVLLTHLTPAQSLDRVPNQVKSSSNKAFKWINQFGKKVKQKVNTIRVKVGSWAKENRFRLGISVVRSTLASGVQAYILVTHGLPPEVIVPSVMSVFSICFLPAYYGTQLGDFMVKEYYSKLFDVKSKTLKWTISKLENFIKFGVLELAFNAAIIGMYTWTGAQHVLSPEGVKLSNLFLGAGLATLTQGWWSESIAKDRAQKLLLPGANKAQIDRVFLVQDMIGSLISVTGAVFTGLGIQIGHLALYTLGAMGLANELRLSKDQLIAFYSQLRKEISLKCKSDLKKNKQAIYFSRTQPVFV